MKVLGATPDAIYDDYLLVNTINPAERSASEMAIRLSQTIGQQVDINLLKPLLATRREWLDTVFATLDREFGSFDVYREKSLGISANDVRILRSRLLS